MRREFPAKVKLAAYDRCRINGKPHCERCGKRILGLPEYDHDLPDGLGGEPTLENCKVLCGTCHRKKTGEEDVPMMAKADRVKRKAAGVRRKRKWPKRRFGS